MAASYPYWQAIVRCVAAHIRMLHAEKCRVSSRNPSFTYCFELLSVGYAMLTHH